MNHQHAPTASPGARHLLRGLASWWAQCAARELACLLRGLTFGELLDGIIFAFVTFVLLALLVVL